MWDNFQVNCLVRVVLFVGKVGSYRREELTMPIQSPEEAREVFEKALTTLSKKVRLQSHKRQRFFLWFGELRTLVVERLFLERLWFVKRFSGRVTL